MLCQDVMACCLSIPDRAEGACFLWLWRIHCTLQLYYSVVLQTEYLENETCLVSDCSTTPDSVTALPKLKSPCLDSLFILTHSVRHLLLITEMTLTYKGKEESSGLSTAQMLVHFRVHFFYFKPLQNMKWLCRQLRSVSFKPNLISFRKRSLSKLCSLKTLLEFASLISPNLIRHQQLSLFISLCCCSHSRKICYSLCPDLMHLFFSFCSRGCEFTLLCGCIVLWRWSSLRPFHFTDQA